MPLPRDSEPSFWRREFTGRKLLFNVLWYGAHIGMFIYGWVSQEQNQSLAALNKLRFSVWISRGAGFVLGFDGTLILIPVCRNLIRVIRPQLTWLMPFDENLWFHRQVAYQLLFWSIVHTTAHYVNFINVERTQIRPGGAYQIHYEQAGGITGHVMNFIIFLMYTTAHHKIRQQCFEAFWYTHHLAFFFMIALYTHATGCFVRDTTHPAYTDTFPFYDAKHCEGYETWRFTIWGGILYFGERVFREIRARRETKIVKVLMHPAGAMEIRFVKPSFKYISGQWLFVQVPEVSRWQWHPFTISSAPDDPYVSVHIRQAGDWTRALGERLGCTRALAEQLDRASKGDADFDEKTGRNSVDQYWEIDPATMMPGQNLPRLRIDGPYGAPTEDVFRAEVAVLIGAGIGVTPFASILKEIWYRQQKKQLGALRKVHFIWIAKETSSFGWIQNLLSQIEASQTDPNFLTISLFLTAKLTEDQAANVILNDVGSDVDPLSLLHSRTNFGRPNWRPMFVNMAQAIESGSYLPGRESSLKSTVHVFFCGPTPLAKSIRLHAKAAATEQVRFTFSKEHF